MLHRAKAKNPEALVVAAGCYAQAAGEKLLDDTAIDLVIGNNKKAELVQLLGEKCVSLDVNSMKPLDNLCHPVSVIKEQRSWRQRPSAQPEPI